MKKLLLLLTSAYFLVACGNQPINITEKLISEDTTRIMTNNYLQTRHELISGNIGKQDANAIWYSLEELESYISYIKQKGKEKGYNVNGIRFFMGAYPNTQQFGEKANLTTLILVPTGNSITTRKGFFQPGTTTDPNNNTNTSGDPENITDIEAMNFGGAGHPPRIGY